MEIHFLELPKLYEYKDAEKNGMLDQWMMFLEARSKEVLEMLAEKNEKIKKAYDILQFMSNDKEIRAAYLAREMELHDEITRLHEAREEGIKEGKKESSLAIAKKLVVIGLNEEDIIKATGLTKEEIEELKKDKN